MKTEVHLYLISDNECSEQLIEYFEISSPIISVNKYSNKDQNYLEKIYTILHQTTKTYPESYIMIMKDNYRPICQYNLFLDILSSILLSTYSWDILHFSNISDKITQKSVNTNIPKLYKLNDIVDLNVVLISPTGRTNMLALDNITSYDKNYTKFTRLSLGHNLFLKDVQDDEVKDIPYIWFLIIVFLTIIIVSFVYMGCATTTKRFK